ncbi:MAG: hypothetical protein ABF586_12770 [Sporolactobacillus sp.]
MAQGQALTRHTLARKKQIYSHEPASGEVITYQLTSAELADLHRKFGLPGTIKYPERLVYARGYHWAESQKRKGKAGKSRR